MAHPAKFPEEIRELLKIDPELPQSMKDIDERSGEPVLLGGEYDGFKAYLLEHLKAKD